MGGINFIFRKPMTSWPSFLFTNSLEKFPSGQRSVVNTDRICLCYISYKFPCLDHEIAEKILFFFTGSPVLTTGSTRCIMVHMDLSRGQRGGRPSPSKTKR